jgi:5-methylcytosine-specific restriction protein B
VGQELDVDVRRTLAALRFTHNVILSGPPGTGKTLAAQQAARWWVESAGGSAEECVWWVALHASFAYEDFVEGIRPSVIQPGAGEVISTEKALPYAVRAGVFREICARAEQDRLHRYVLVLDEINRGSLTKILGELIPLIEDDKRGKLALRLPYSGERFSVPPNLYLLGTMNTADRSIALIDSALRRRFAFVPFAPRPGLLEGATVETDEALLSLDLLLERLNAALTGALDSDHQIGHSYFLRVAAAPEEERLSTLEMVWNHQVLPLLEEYFFNRRQRLADILTPFVEDNSDLNARPQFMLLYGEDLVVALSRLCE